MLSHRPEKRESVGVRENQKVLAPIKLYFAGNSVVYKPSPLSPLTARLLGELLQEAGLPDGVYNVVQVR